MPLSPKPKRDWRQMIRSEQHGNTVMAKYFVPYELAVKELTVKFKHMIEEYHENDRYSPIEQVSGRVKSVSSILEKMQRKDIPIEQLETEMEDLAGVRIICQLKKISIPLLRSIRKRNR